MKKVLLGLLVVSSLSVGCKKSNSVCWECTFGQSVSGYTPPPKTICNDGTEPTNLKDNEGNDISFTCKKR